MTLMMSVSGVRGIVGESLTPVLAAELGCAFGSHVGGGRVVVGRDSRPSGPMLSRALEAGLLATGCDVVDLGVVTTPGVGVMVTELGAAGGVVITASHNPLPYNGIKFLTAQGFAPPPELAQQILDRCREKRFSLADAVHTGGLSTNDATHEAHVGRVLRTLDVDAIRQARFKVALDSVNGAGGTGGRMLLEQLGCEIVHVNAEPTGRFSHPPEPTAENLTGLCEAVRAAGADVGFAQDPDADRLAVVDAAGRCIGEEYTIVLAAKVALAGKLFQNRPFEEPPGEKTEAPWRYEAASKQAGAIAVNLSTSRMIDDAAAQAGGDVVVHRTAVGEANVVRAMRELGCLIGGEGNGGVIDPRVVLVRDSFAGMGLILNLMAQEARPLAAIVDELPHYVMRKTKFEMPAEQIQAWLAKAPQVVGDGTISDLDGLRIDWPQGWVHLRASNTEPIARVIAEAPDAATAEALIQRVTALL